MTSDSRLPKAISVLQQYRRARKEDFRTAATILKAFRRAGLSRSLLEDKERNVHQAQRVMHVFRAKGLHHFDIFRTAGFIATEKGLSDAVASLIDPKRAHRLGIWPLKILLKKLRNRAPARVGAISRALRKPVGDIQVLRERHEEKTTPDIEIVSRKFLIFIEHKLRGGGETYLNGQPQTSRQWNALEQKCTRDEIPIERCLAIFLTPEGKQPAHSEFVSLSVDELASAFLEAMKMTRKCPSKHSIKAFLHYYRNR